MAILTVYTKLLDQTLTGPRIVDMGSTRTCQLYVIPRDKVQLLNKEKPLHQHCFYILVGSGNDGKKKAYIGQSNDFLQRVKDHQIKKTFWDTALVFVSKANEIFASEVLFLEYLGITQGLKSGTYALDENKQIPQKPSIALDKENDMELFFEEIRFLTQFFGCNIFEPHAAPDNAPEKFSDFTFSQPSKGIQATLRYFPESQRYVILAGSTVTSQAGKSIPEAIKQLRNKVFSSKDKAICHGNTYELLQDIETPHSPSAAASFCTGTSMQGPKVWIDQEGKSFAEVCH